MDTTVRVLNIAKDRDARQALRLELSRAGFDVIDMESPDEATALCRAVAFDVLLLRADSDSLAARTCRTLRLDAPQAVILALTESEEPRRTIEILEAGADCCFSGSTYLPELTAHLRAAVRLRARGVSRSAAPIAIGDISLEPARRTVTRGNVPVNLSPPEFALLHHMMAHPGTPLTHASLMTAVWGNEPARRTEHLRRLVRELRVKLHDDQNPQYILTDTRLGYRFVDAEKVSRAA
jgi:two-component system KDP operon response regulator KdpE